MLLIVLIVGLCVVISLQPSTFQLERSARMAASPGEVFAQVNDFGKWDSWTPWTKLDPHAKTKLSNPSFGKGATFGWSGNEEIGEGILTIVASQPNERVEVEQEFFKPFAGKARMTFAFAPVDDETLVVWHMSGENDFMGKAMCLVMNMETMLGPKFEEGLANLKAVVEQSDAEPAE